MNSDAEEKKPKPRFPSPNITVRSELVDHWLPLIGSEGLGQFVYLIRSGARNGTGCYPSHKLMARVLNRSEATVNAVNWLLETAGLLEVVHGEKTIGEKRKPCNRYYVKDGLGGSQDKFPRASKDKILKVLSGLDKLPKYHKRFASKIRRRCARWQPVQLLWRERRKMREQAGKSSGA